MYWALVIDGREVRRDKYVKPLIDELRYYAQGDEFRSATIKQFSRNYAPACGHRAAVPGLVWCAHMRCYNYVNKHQEEWQQP